METDIHTEKRQYGDYSGAVQEKFESSLRDIAVFSLREIRLSEGDLVRFTHQEREQGRDTQILWEVTRIAGNGISR